jgi:hypothetical protein
MESQVVCFVDGYGALVQPTWDALFDSNNPTDDAIYRRIRRIARAHGWYAKKSRRNGLWYFADQDNMLLTSERGLDVQEAYEWLLQPN